MKINGKQKYDEYILIAPGSDYGRAMWSDIGELENGSVLEKAIASENRLVNLLHHIHFSFALNSRVQLPFQNVWKNAYALSKIHLQPSKKYCIIYTDVSAGRTDRKYLSDLQKKGNVDTVLVMVNTMVHRKDVLKSRLLFFDYIFSFDQNDCEKYGFIYHPTNYSSVAMMSNEKTEVDAFYVGVSKGRQEKLEDIFARLKKGGAKCSFYISRVKKKNVPEIHYNEWLSYKQVLECIKRANCIVEVMEGQQTGVTLRTMEAICYNKRLLTNNRSVRELPFFKTGYIQFFENVSDIDPDFVKDKSVVDYGYNNEFSPVHLIEHINQI